MMGPCAHISSLNPPSILIDQLHRRRVLVPSPCKTQELCTTYDSLKSQRFLRAKLRYKSRPSRSLRNEFLAVLASEAKQSSPRLRHQIVSFERVEAWLPNCLVALILSLSKDAPRKDGECRVFQQPASGQLPQPDTPAQPP
jgi:hypothetical protein